MVSQQTRGWHADMCHKIKERGEWLAINEFAHVFFDINIWCSVEVECSEVSNHFSIAVVEYHIFLVVPDAQLSEKLRFEINLITYETREASSLYTCIAWLVSLYNGLTYMRRITSLAYFTFVSFSLYCSLISSELSIPSTGKIYGSSYCWGKFEKL